MAAFSTWKASCARPHSQGRLCLHRRGGWGRLRLHRCWLEAGCAYTGVAAGGGCSYTGVAADGAASERPPREGVILRALSPEGSRVQHGNLLCPTPDASGLKAFSMTPTANDPYFTSTFRLITALGRLSKELKVLVSLLWL